MFSDPLKLLPLGVCLVAAVGLLTHTMTANEVMGLLTLAGAGHSAISAVNNVNPPKQ